MYKHTERITDTLQSKPLTSFSQASPGWICIWNHFCFQCNQTQNVEACSTLSLQFLKAYLSNLIDYTVENTCSSLNTIFYSYVQFHNYNIKVNLIRVRNYISEVILTWRLGLWFSKDLQSDGLRIWTLSCTVTSPELEIMDAIEILDNHCSCSSYNTKNII